MPEWDRQTVRYSTNPRINTLYTRLIRRYWPKGMGHTDNPTIVHAITHCAVYGGYRVAQFENGAAR